jgi:hypothetical protein
VFSLAHLLGFELMPRIRNWKDLNFYRPGRHTSYVHIDALFEEAGKNVVDWTTIESHFKDLMRVAISVREGAISSTLLLRRLRSGSRKNATYTAFREVGRVIRTVQLLRYLSDPAMRRRVTAATNKVEAYNAFSEWLHFGNRGVIADNDPVEQEKAMKFNSLLTNAVIFHNTLDIAEVVRDLQAEGWSVDPEDLAQISPYLTENIKRFGEYSTHELAIEPQAYEPHPNVDFTKLRGDFDEAARPPGRRPRERRVTPPREGVTRRSRLPTSRLPARSCAGRGRARSWVDGPSTVVRELRRGAAEGRFTPVLRWGLPRAGVPGSVARGPDHASGHRHRPGGATRGRGRLAAAAVPSAGRPSSRVGTVESTQFFVRGVVEAVRGDGAGPARCDEQPSPARPWAAPVTAVRHGIRRTTGTASGVPSQLSCLTRSCRCLT